MTAPDGKHGDKIKTRILNAGLKLWPNATARAIGREIGMTHSAVLYHFGTAAALTQAVAVHAVETGRSAVIVQLIAAKHPAVSWMGRKDRDAHSAAAGL